MKKNNYPFIVVITSLCMLVTVLVSGTAVINAGGVHSKLALENGYKRAYYDVCDSVNNLEVNLSKVMIASSVAETVPLLTDVAAQAELAQNSLCSLPIESGDVRLTGKYFNQVGDWCKSYAGAIMEKKDVSVYREQAITLYNACVRLNAALRESSDQVTAGSIAANMGQAGRLSESGWKLDFGDLENHTVEYPELIYDGPFSDAKKYAWRALEGKEEVSEEAAAAIVSEKTAATDIALVGRTDGKADLYEFTAKRDGADVYVSVSVKGGYIVNYGVSRTIDASGITEREAQKSAVEFAAKLGYEGLEPVWYNAQNGIGYVNLAPKPNGVTMYPDLVKVKVALDNGQPIGIEAGGYCSSHRDRSTSPVLGEKTARALVSDRLAITAVNLAVIPVGEDDEALCYEVCGSFMGLDYFVYVDAIDGTERDVMRVVDSDQGTMIM